MTIRVLMFASLAQATGYRELALQLPDGATVGAALALLSEQYGPIAALGGKLATAVNLSYARPEQVLAPGDELALIGPVSGG